MTTKILACTHSAARSQTAIIIIVITHWIHRLPAATHNTLEHRLPAATRPAIRAARPARPHQGYEGYEGS